METIENKPLTCWGVTSGSAGMEAQVKALAAALKLTLEMKKATVKAPFVWLPNVCYASPLRNFVVPHFLDSTSDSLSPAYPDVIISCGRRAAMVAMGLRARDKKPYYIHIQDPQVSSKYFDLVVAMEHDAITGPNVIKMRFALHALTPEAMEAAQLKFTERFAAYSHPRIAVLIGGSTNKYTLTREAMAQIIMKLQGWLSKTQASLLITPSRRTGEENIAMLKAVFAANPRVYIYDGVEENPYLGLLALADAIIVTNDSVNMMSEAHATGKPLYLLPLPGHAGTKPSRFAEMLIANSIARPLDNKLESWAYPTNDEMKWLADEIRQRLSHR